MSIEPHYRRYSRRELLQSTSLGSIALSGMLHADALAAGPRRSQEESPLSSREPHSAAVRASTIGPGRDAAAAPWRQ